METVTFSDLQLRGKATVEGWLRRSQSRALRIQRRDAEDLVLTTATRAAQAREASSVTVRIFVALIQRDPQVLEQVAEIVPDVFPWVAFLSHEEMQEFVTELMLTMQSADAIDNPAPVVQVIDSWRHTAEVLADPELTAALIEPSEGDFGPVTQPSLG